VEKPWEVSSIDAWLVRRGGSEEGYQSAEGGWVQNAEKQVGLCILTLRRSVRFTSLSYPPGHSTCSSVKTLRAFGSLHSMSNGSPGPGSAPILHRAGLAGALARFSQRSYAADYIALGFLALGWVMVSGPVMYYRICCC
jgi:hypothetical protein